MTSWTFGDLFEAVAAAVPDNPAHIHGDRTITWSESDRRADALAADLLAAGLGEQAKVAAYLYNGPEYLEVYSAAFKAGLVPVNTNYRYGPEEIRYLFDNADAEAVVFHASFSTLIDGLRAQLPKVKRWYVVDDVHGVPGERPSWATPYEDVAGRTDAPRGVRGPWGRSGDHLLFLYTGGTTGMPKGVMWRQDDLFNVLGAGGHGLLGIPPATDLEDFRTRIGQVPLRMIPACPLMHGTGQFSAFIALALGGCVVTLDSRNFSSAHLFDTVERNGVQTIVIVGDAFAKPMLAELNANPGRWDLSSLIMITSSGVMWSQESKDGMLDHMPQVALVDSFGSSEAVGLGASVSTKGAAAETAKFQLGPTVHVYTDDDRQVLPGSDDTGMVAISGFVPIGYYKDPEKSAKTFRTIDGVRYSIPGDYAQVNADGTLHLLGRGSVCINTGGEKVFPEEVEEVLKTHPAVRDAVCVGIPDERFGEVICALVEPSGATPVVADEVIEHVRARLARYKAPRHVLTVDSIGRSPAGKVDYKRLTAQARDTLA